MFIVFPIVFYSFVNNKLDQKLNDRTPQQLKAEEIVRQKETTLQVEEAKKAAADLATWQVSPAGKICAQHPDWSKDICQAIAEDKVRVGMNAEQATAGWGKPQDINRTTNSYGVSEQWVYGSGSYLYFDDGVLTSISN